MSRPGGRILVDQLELHGVELAFGVPGESYLAVLDALHDSPIRFVVCRHEVGAANMADAYGKLTGRPGICMVTRGPGRDARRRAAIHTAFQDSTPLILLIGQVGRDMLEREAFQEIDYRQMFGPMAKWVAQIDEAERIPELVARAFHVATSGRPGPVVLALPEDMLVEEADVADAAPYEPTRTHPGADDLERMRALLQGAARPLVVVGGQPWSAGGARRPRRLVRGGRAAGRGRRSAARTTSTTRSPVYAGHLTLGQDPRLARACARRRRAPRRRRPAQRDHDLRLHAPRRAAPARRRSSTCTRTRTSSAASTSRTLAIVAGPPQFARGPARRAAARRLGVARRDGAGARRVPREPPAHARSPATSTWATVTAHLRERLPADAIITNGAGNFSVWAHRFYEFHTLPHASSRRRAAAMGYGVPAAVAAKLVAARSGPSSRSPATATS